MTAQPSRARTTVQATPLPPWAARELAKVEGEFARVWVALAGDQMTRNADAQRRLAAARDLREAAAIHEDLARNSLERIAEAVERCLDLQVAMAARLVGAHKDAEGRGPA